MKLWCLVYELNGRDQWVPIWEEPRLDIQRIVILSETENELVLKAIKGPSDVEVTKVTVPKGFKFPRIERREVNLEKPKSPKPKTKAKKRGRKKKKK